jgi:DNA-directed RNA polymerase subunit E'/Rpb7
MLAGIRVADHHKVLFNAVIFRPFVGEICRGKIAACNPEGITLSLGFFNNIHVAPHRLQVSQV